MYCCRREQARLLGYENFGQMSMETKMAGSVENVLSMITSLLAKGKHILLSICVDSSVLATCTFQTTSGFTVLYFIVKYVPTFYLQQRSHRKRKYLHYKPLLKVEDLICNQRLGILTTGDGSKRDIYTSKMIITEFKNFHSFKDKQQN